MAASQPAGSSKTVKEGWLYKRGEHIKNWRSRWLILKSDGTFLGFKDKPPPGQAADPQNKFRIDATVSILESDKPKKNTFLVRCLLWTTFVERLFCAENEQERREWVAAIQKVSTELKKKQRKEDDLALQTAKQDGVATSAPPTRDIATNAAQNIVFTTRTDPPNRFTLVNPFDPNTAVVKNDPSSSTSLDVFMDNTDQREANHFRIYYMNGAGDKLFLTIQNKVVQACQTGGVFEPINDAGQYTFSWAGNGCPLMFNNMEVGFSCNILPSPTMDLHAVTTDICTNGCGVSAVCDFRPSSSIANQVTVMQVARMLGDTSENGQV